MKVENLQAYEEGKELELAAFFFPVCALPRGFRAFLALKIL